MKFGPFLAPAACAVLGACSQFPGGSPAERAPKPMVVPLASQAAAPNVQADSADRLWVTTFKSPSRTPEGGVITSFAFSEKQGDALVSPLAVQGDVLAVTGQFFGKGASAWGGLGVNIGAPRSMPVKAGDYRFLTIRLSSATSTRLRVRLVGPDEATQRLGCYPMVWQAVKPEAAEYRIALERFAPEGYCGPKGVALKPTLESLTGIEVAEAAAPMRDRTVSFGVGAIGLAR
ncbi:hypothetical protein [Rhizobacter sp. OV335]|uniref:hypothetical protein n=1 Tax=Rhizobacter sp. OV335 TaxID=1500264 RepID=UPI000915630A|nr:hypothetical protein [Rhizobacter sp. OV335]SHN13084.1 hypothetical protein SAMN02787076_03477 [Rhizobacter sp. OV335]